MLFLRSPQPPDMEASTEILVNDLAAFPGEVTIVFDDYHVIDSEPVHRIVSSLLNHLPSNVHLIISSRIDPHLPLPRLRARGRKPGRHKIGGTDRLVLRRHRGASMVATWWGPAPSLRDGLG
jgi:hypothetical protein